MARPARHGAGAWPIPRRHGGCPGNHRPAAARPFSLQSRQPRGQTALTDAENILAFSTQNLPDELAADPCLANDPPDQHAIISHLANHPIGLLAAQIASVAVAGDDLNPRTGPQPGLDRGRFPVLQEVNNPAPL
jgi:hypothetical protein